jgi:hypothetical protein
VTPSTFFRERIVDTLCRAYEEFGLPGTLKCDGGGGAFGRLQQQSPTVSGMDHYWMITGELLPKRGAENRDNFAHTRPLFPAASRRTAVQIQQRQRIKSVISLSIL